MSNDPIYIETKRIYAALINKIPASPVSLHELELTVTDMLELVSRDASKHINRGYDFFSVDSSIPPAVDIPDGNKRYTMYSSFSSLEQKHDLKRFAEDLAMAYYKCHGGKEYLKTQDLLDRLNKEQECNLEAQKDNYIVSAKMINRAELITMLQNLKYMYPNIDNIIAAVSDMDSKTEYEIFRKIDHEYRLEDAKQQVEWFLEGYLDGKYDASELEIDYEHLAEIFEAKDDANVAENQLWHDIISDYVKELINDKEDPGESPDI